MTPSGLTDDPYFSSAAQISSASRRSWRAACEAFSLPSQDPRCHGCRPVVPEARSRVFPARPGITGGVARGPRLATREASWRGPKGSERGTSCHLPRLEGLAIGLARYAAHLEGSAAAALGFENALELAANVLLALSGFRRGEGLAARGSHQ